METWELTYPLIPVSAGKPVALALGFFDGVHRGHQAVIQEAKALAQKWGAVFAVMTFHPHPREVLGQAKIDRYLTPLSEKLAQFARLGVERTYVMKFDSTFAALTREEFVEKVLVPLGVKGVATGFNFTFGRFAAGKAEDLPRLGAGRFEARIASPVALAGGAVSSTRLRCALLEGKVESAAEMLGRHYALEGTVVSGDRRGRLLGFPTANLRLEEPYFTPKRGVYVVRTRMKGESFFGIMNIGVRPTFSDPEPRERLEVHLLGTRVDLYGERLRVEFLHFLREERKFPSAEALAEQIRADKAKAEQWLAAFCDPFSV
jgi:riboflavin kinase/FMN adenylyltransferase